MYTIDIKKQPRMGLGRALTMTLHGIRFRLFRSAVTVMVIVVAVAFLMNVACESVVKKSVVRTTEQRIAASRLAVRWAARLSGPGTAEEIIRRIAASVPGGGYDWETRQLSGLSAAAMDGLRARAQAAMTYLDFFAALDYAKARRLCHRSRGVAIFEFLQSPEARARFVERLAEIRSVRFVSSTVDFEAFLGVWPQLQTTVAGIRARRAAAVEAVSGQLGDRDIMQALTEADGAFGMAVRQAGFHIDDRAATEVARLAREAVDMRLLVQSIGNPEVRSLVAAYLDVLPGDVSSQTLWRLLRSRRTAAWYVQRLARVEDPAAAIPLERMLDLADLQAQHARLASAERIAVAVHGGIMGLGERMSWLLVVSMVVCIVGISNAMLMAVTERFREIATLKCLGALDGTIMAMFVLEACLFGVVGGAAGTLLGALIGLGRMFALFGATAMRAVQAGPLGAAMAAAVALGVFLAAVASVYPSFRAARLAPMEAMRIE